MTRISTYKGHDLHVDEKGKWSIEDVETRKILAKDIVSMDAAKAYIRKNLTTNKLNVFYVPLHCGTLRKTVITSVHSEKRYGREEVQARYKTEIGGSATADFKNFYEATEANERIHFDYLKAAEQIAALKRRQGVLAESLEKRLTYERFLELAKGEEQDE